ncbi:MAG: hypothetical protein NC313_17065, partial [Butyrivibrio sp.]|nr:hypothetical protein [Butyrivibrio sp.]
MTARTGINIKLHIILSMLLLAFGLSLCVGIMKMTVHADYGDFNIDAQLLSSVDETYNISVTVENTGDDWEGIVRLKMEYLDLIYFDACAYDTAISLPQGSIKQFEVKVPKQAHSFMDLSGSIKIFLIDENSQPVFSKRFDELLIVKKEALRMGILSDSYSSLSFMAVGGEELEWSGGSYPIKLVELNQDNLLSLLDSLEFLIIDNYNTGVLTDYELAALEKWNRNGGVLIVGTGKYAKNTLAGLDYLDVEYVRAYDEEDSSYSWSDSFVYPEDLYAEVSYISALVREKGDGSIGVLSYSLTESAGLYSDAYIYIMQNDFIYDTLDTISLRAHKRYEPLINMHGVSTSRTSEMFLSAFGNGRDSLSFGLLKIIIVIYVILAGPVLYLILRYLNKKDLYWFSVPALSFVGVIIVMFAGWGLAVARTRVYSVTIFDMLGQEDCMTYMHCYNAGHNEWELRLSKDYEYAAPASTDYIYDDDYDYRVLKEGEELFFGAKPDSSFEDVYFFAGKRADIQSIGSIDCNESIYADKVRRINKVTNNTGYDFEYLAVIDDNKL